LGWSSTDNLADTSEPNFFKPHAIRVGVKTTPEKKYFVIAQGYGIFITPLGGYVFPYEEHDKIKRTLSHCDRLNLQACAILEKCTGSHTVNEIIHLLEKEFEDIPEDFSSQIHSFLDEAVQKGYVSCSETPTPLQGILQGSLKYYVPSQALIETTSDCNLKCGHCLLPAGEPLKDELTASQFIPILEGLYEIGVKRLNLSGGEILTKAGWEDLVDYCVDRFHTILLTNAIMMTEEIADKMTCLKEVYVSLYGIDTETNEKITQVKSSFEYTLRGIKLLTERGILVGISVLIVPFNMEQLEDVVKIAISLKCRIVRVGIVCSLGRARDKKWNLTKDQMSWLDTKIAELRQKYKEIDVRWEEEQGESRACGAGFTRWVVAANGDVYPCAIFRIPIGNLARDDPIDICMSSGVKFLVELESPHSELCGSCRYFYLCSGCHGEASTHCFEVDHCGWAHQFKEAPEPFRNAIWEKIKNKK
jgi:radical SAM protein with 4Fe4S-binding SPASM domain